MGQTVLAHALGPIVGRQGSTVLAVRPDHRLTTLTPARLTPSHEAELRTLGPVAGLRVDDVRLDARDAPERRDADARGLPRHRTGSRIVPSTRGPDEWLATFATPVRAPRTIDGVTPPRRGPRHRGRVLSHAADADPHAPRAPPRKGTAAR